MTKLITAVIILLFLWGGWELFFYWEKVKNEQETQKKQAAAAQVLGENLPGIPFQSSQQMEQSLKAAQNQGASAMRNWLKLYGNVVQDPRRPGSSSIIACCFRVKILPPRSDCLPKSKPALPKHLRSGLGSKRCRNPTTDFFLAIV